MTNLVASKRFILGATIALTSSAYSTLVVTESFDYTVGSNVDGSGAAVDGWAGAWAFSGGSNLPDVAEGLSFGTLESSGGSSQRPTRIGNGAITRSISGDSQTALTVSGTTIWFSVLMQATAPTDPVGNGGFATNSFGTLIFGSDGLSGGSGGGAAPIIGTGSALGVSFADTNDNSGNFANMQIQGVTYNGGTLTQGTADRITVGESTTLIVGSIEWAADGADDTLSLFNVLDPTAPLPAAFTTLTADLDQSTFDVVSIGDAQTSVFDEIRIGTTVEDVLPAVPEPSSTLLIGLSSLVLLRRRR